jgi:hypothetical protein
LYLLERVAISDSKCKNAKVRYRCVYYPAFYFKFFVDIECYPSIFLRSIY